MSLRALARANALGWIVLILLAGCGGRRQALELESAPRAIDPAEYSLVELDKRPAPDGVNAETWTALKAALRAALGGNRQSSALGLRLTDFPIANLAAAPYSGGAAQLTWTYAGSGDYDLNGAVTISDITPLARYFGAKATDVDWSSARVADGNRDGEVNIADVTPIGASFGLSFDAFQVLRYSGLIGPDDLYGFDMRNFTLLQQVPLSAGVKAPGGLQFQFDDPAGQPNVTYRIRPIQLVPTHPDGYYAGAYSNFAVVPLAVGPWPMQGHDPQRTSRAEVAGPTRANIAWTYAPAYRWYEKLHATNEALYFVDNGHVGRIDKATGAEFDFDYVGYPVWYVVLGDGAVMLMLQNGSITCFEPDGAVRFQSAPYASLSSGNPTIADDGNVYFLADVGTARTLMRCTPQGEVTALFQAPGAGYQAPGVFNNDDFLLTTEYTVQRYSSAGELLAVSEQLGDLFSQPVVGSDQRVYVDTFGDLQILDGTDLHHLYGSGFLAFVGSSATGVSDSIRLDLAEGRVYMQPYVEGPLFALDLQANVLWSRALSTAQYRYLTMPELSAGHVVTDSLGQLTALGPQGGVSWQVDTLEDALDIATAPDGTVYDSCYDGYLYVVAPNGTLETRRHMFDIGPEFTCPLTTADGSLYFLRDNNLTRMRTTDNVQAENWFFLGRPDYNSALFDNQGNLIGTTRVVDNETGAHTDTASAWTGEGYSGFNTSLPANDGALQDIALLPDGSTLHTIGASLYALDPSGALRWTYTPGENLVAAPAVATDGTIYTLSSGNVIALDPAGKELWRQPLDDTTASSGGIAVNETQVCVAANVALPWHASVYVYDRASHALVWKNGGPSVWPGKPALGADGTLYIAQQYGTGNGNLNQLIGYTPAGERRWLCDLPLPPGSSAPLLDAAGNIFVAGNKGVVAVNSGGTVIWSQPLDFPYGDAELGIGPEGTLYVAGEGTLYALSR